MVESRTTIRQAYGGVSRRKYFLLLLLLVFLAGVLLLSLFVGSASLSPGQVFHTTLSGPFGKLAKEVGYPYIVIWELRFPRILMGVIAGMALSISGTAVQGVLKNPLASPYVLGIASAAACGASVAIVLGAGVISVTDITISHTWMVVLAAFFFSLIPMMVLLGVAKIKDASSHTILLVGIAMMYLFSAATAFLQFIGTEEQVAAIVHWTFGSLSKSDWRNLAIVVLVFLFIAPVFMKWSWNFNVLSSGDESAESLGVNVNLIKIVSLLLACMATSTTVAFLGTIGFIGLVGPHIARIVIGEDHRFLFPASALVGGLLLIVSDTMARTIIAPCILPVGIITAFLGVPLFIGLILKRRGIDE